MLVPGAGVEGESGGEAWTRRQTQLCSWVLDGVGAFLLRVAPSPEHELLSVGERELGGIQTVEDREVTDTLMASLMERDWAATSD